MELFRDTNFDFFRAKRVFISVSVLTVIASLGLMMTKGFTYGIDFRGGADVQLTFKDTPNVAELRSSLADAGFSGLTIQTIGEAGENGVLIRLDPGAAADDPDAAPEKEDIASDILAALRTSQESSDAVGKIDLNVAGDADIRAALADGLGAGAEAEVASAAQAVTAARNDAGGLLRSIDAAAGADGVLPAAAQWLRDNAVVGRFAIRSVDYVGPAVGGELRSKARWAVFFSLMAMLIYIGFRFHGGGYGVAAIVTLAHDVIVTLGFLSALGKEFDLTVLAAVLTVVGYSVNDTIVIFDRVRDNLRLQRGVEIEKVFNSSINQTLSRTVLTSGLVFVVLLSIWMFGGSRLEPFSFALLIGTVSGTYSTMYIASPLVIWWLRWSKRREARA
jgi:preprotein translocase subunit SecF